MLNARELQAMKLKDLVKLDSDIKEAIAEKKVTEAQETRQEMVDYAKRKGFSSLEEIFGKKLYGSKKGGYKSTMAPKYRNPEDPSKTWTGRGRKPNWLAAKIDKGASLDQFRA